MLKLQVREVATRKGFTLTEFQLAIRLPLSTARRYWHGSASGLERDAGSLKLININTLEAIAEVLDVPISQLITRESR